MVRLGVRRRLDLDQPLDLEAVRAQQADPLAVGQVELDAAVGPLETAHAELRVDEPFRVSEMAALGWTEREVFG